jgi:chaperonin GroES
MAIKPLADRVLIKPLDASEEKVGSIYIPDTAKEKPQEGKVEAIGPGRHEDGKLIPLDVKVGDRVLYGKYSGTEIKHDGKEFLIVRESDILAILG